MTRIAVLVGIAALAVAVWASGLHASVTPESVAELVGRAGIFGPIAFVLLFAAAEIVHVPGLLFVYAAAALWPPEIAVPTAYVGAVTASVVVFFIARRLVPGAVRERLPDWLLRYESRLETHGLRTVILLRFVLFLLPAVHWLLGASRVSFRDFFLGTAIGLLPGVTLNVLLGRQAFAHWDVLKPWVLGGVAVLIAIAIARRLSARRHRTE